MIETDSVTNNSFVFNTIMSLLMQYANIQWRSKTTCRGNGGEQVKGVIDKCNIKLGRSAPQDTSEKDEETWIALVEKQGQLRLQRKK